MTIYNLDIYITVSDLDIEIRIWKAGEAALELCALSYGLRQSLIFHVDKLFRGLRRFAFPSRSLENKPATNNSRDV
jgi:hypothetical protein